MLARYGAPCRVLPPPYSYTTSRSSVYVLNRAEGVRMRDVLKLDDELDDALTRLRGGQTATRFITNPLAVAVPRRQPSLVSAGAMLGAVGRRDDLVATLGEHYDHAANPAYGGERSPSWLRVNLSAAETPHMLVAGTTGSGKTVVMKNIVLSLAVACDPQTTAMLLIDVKAAKGLPGLEGLPHLAHPVISDGREAAGALAAVVEELFRRSAAAKAEPHRRFAWTRIVVVVDELAQTIERGGDAVQKHIDSITALGRGVDIHFVGGTQKPTKELLGQTIMSNMPVRAVGAVATKEEGGYATGMAPLELGAHKLSGSGDFILTIGGNRKWDFQSAYIDPDQEARIVAGIRREGREAGFRIRRPASPVREAAAEEDRLLAAEPLPTIPPPGGLSRSEVQARHAATILAIRDEHTRLGKWPSAYRVVALHQGLHGKKLNAETAAKLLERAKGEGQ